MKKKYVLMVGSHPSVKGGISSVVTQLLNFDFPNDITINFVATHIEHKNIYKILYFLKALISITYQIIFKKIDIVHIHMSYKGSFYRKYAIFKLSKLFNKSILLHLHGSEFETFFYNTNKITQKMIKNLLLDADIVLVLGEKWREKVLKIEPLSNVVIYMNSIKLVEAPLKVEKDSIQLLFLGSLIERKGIYNLVNALKLLNDDNILEQYNVYLYIGGCGKEGSKLKEKVHSLNLEKRIKFSGWIEDDSKNNLLRNSDVFILPSFNEGLPVAILEALNYGLPVISTRVGSIDEAVVDEYNGFMIDPNNDKDIADKLTILIKNKEIINKYGKNSRLLCEKKFNQEIYIKELYSIYDTLVDGRN